MANAFLSRLHTNTERKFGVLESYSIPSGNKTEDVVTVVNGHLLDIT